MAQVGRLHGKVAIVTGAAGGIGKAICERFLAEGSKVMMVDCNEDNLKDTYGRLNANYKGQLAMIQCDVAAESSASDAFSTSHSQFGQNCNVLVNCAGIAPFSAIVETTMASFNHILDVNLKGVFTFTKEFLRRLELDKNKDVTGASIVNVASIGAKVGFKNCSHYCASKAGVVAFTKTTCIEVGKYGVRCNAVLPGPTDTALVLNVDEATLEAVKAMIPMGRLGKPVEVANACLFLASDESSYINGAILEITGGWMA